MCTFLFSFIIKTKLTKQCVSNSSCWQMQRSDFLRFLRKQRYELLQTKRKIARTYLHLIQALKELVACAQRISIKMRVAGKIK